MCGVLNIWSACLKACVDSKIVSAAFNQTSAARLMLPIFPGSIKADRQGGSNKRKITKLQGFEGKRNSEIMVRKQGNIRGILRSVSANMGCLLLSFRVNEL